MNKLELRARARAAARASGLVELGGEGSEKLQDSPRVRSSAARARTPGVPIVDTIDESQARSACKPMGELETIVHAVNADGTRRALYVIVPDPAMSAEYERLGFRIEPGCRILLDAAALQPLAVLYLSPRRAESPPRPNRPATGFNPYFDMPST